MRFTHNRPGVLNYPVRGAYVSSEFFIEKLRWSSALPSRDAKKLASDLFTALDGEARFSAEDQSMHRYIASAYHVILIGVIIPKTPKRILAGS